MLVYDYEEKYEHMPTLKTVELLKALLEESNLQPQDLVSIFGGESIVLEVLQGERKLTKQQIEELAHFFKISSDSF